ncbi:hypothetical protein ACFYUD_19045 [Nocardia tengchongensis]|uniref:hypothetical protein n=1 Tax=Nocardia tengchongensis TaxID=2055889 RepID=UPI0036B63F28
MTNPLLVLAILDIALMTILIIIYRIPPLSRRLQATAVVQRYWRPGWPDLRTMIMPLVLVMTGVLVGIGYLM